MVQRNVQRNPMDRLLHYYSRPLNRRANPRATHRYHETGKLCGDDLTIALTIRDGVVEDAAFDGQCCAVTTAAASVLTEWLKGRQVAELDRFGEQELLHLLDDPVLPPSRRECLLLPLEAARRAAGREISC